MQTALSLAGLQKSFGGIPALRSGSLEARSGEVHLVLGENGAGKSTMMRIAAGMLAPEAGSIHLHGRPRRFASPREAQDAGIALVHQESLLAPHLTVAENIYLGREPQGRFGLVDREAMMASARRLITRYGFALDPAARVSTLAPAGRQLVEICRAMALEASVVIFDEPTSALSEIESAQVFRIVDELRRQGRAVIYITHRMEELRRVGDRATVLRDGETVMTALMSDVSNEELIRHMVGRPLDNGQRRRRLAPGDELFRAEGLTKRGAFENISFTLRAGEVVGLAGLMGAGRTELCRAVFGASGADSGRMRVMGAAYRPRSPRDAVRAGLALAPEDRQVDGLAAMRPLGENITLPALSRYSPGGVLRRRRETAAAQSIMERLRIRAASAGQRAGELSGGNQQKAVLAKWLLAEARIFLLDEPTRGIDIASKLEVAALVDELARQGAAVLLVSSELPELLQLADRIIILRHGRIAAELDGATTQEEIMRHAALA